MNCTQIRNRLSDPTAYHAPDVQEHIRECAECRAMYESESVLRDSIASERAHVPASDYSTAALWVDRVISKERKHIMPSLISRPFATPARRWGLGIVVAALAFFVLVPFPYENTVGTRLMITSQDYAMTKIDVDAIKARLIERGMPDVSVMRTSEPSSHSLTYHVHGTQADAQAAFEATRDLVPSIAATGEIKLAPWTVKESGSLFAQITGSSFSYNVSTSGRSDAEIAQDIRSQLESQGMQVQNVSVARDDTSTTFNMTFTPPGGEGRAVIKQVIAGDHAGEPMEGKVFMPQVDKSLPIDEQVAEIKRQLAANGITDVEVTIEDGKIKVEAKKEEQIRR
jgi:hypothetical protein